MLSATLYRFRRQTLKKPWVLVLAIIAIAFCVFMMFVPAMSEGDEDAPVRNASLVMGAANLIMIVMFDYMFYSGLKSGAVGFTNADVNFYLAGPFTQRFNLMLAAMNIVKVGAIFAFLLCTQTGVLSMAIGVGTADMFAIIIGSFIVNTFGYFLGAFFCTHFDENEKAKKITLFSFLGLNIVYLALNFAELLRIHGSLSGIKAQGGKAIISTIGNTIYSKVFPVGGWTRLIYDGIFTSDALNIVIGTILLVALAVLLWILFSRCEINYYETALQNAQKVADLVEAKRAGVDSDTANINRKIKIGKETLKSGEGASVFLTRHLLENKRATKLFFLNPLTFLYRVICVFYLIIMGGSTVNVNGDGGAKQTLIMALMMILMLNLPIYGGGKTVLEFNKPFIFLSPQKGWVKLMYCLLSDLPEMIFDSILCSVILWYFVKLSVVEALVAPLMFIGFAYLCETTALVTLRLFKPLGRYTLMFIRYFLIAITAVLVVVPALILSGMTGLSTNMGFFLFAAALSAVYSLLLLLVSRNVVDKVEYAA